MHEQTALSRLVHWLATSQYAALPDDALLARIAAQPVDPDALRALMARFGRRVYVRGLHETGSAEAADEVYQETFVALARNARSIRNGAALSSWLDRTALRAGRRARRRELCRKAAEAKAAVANDVAVSDGAEKTEVVRAVLQAVAGLPDRYRVAITAHYSNGESIAATAKELGLSEAGTKSRIHRALAMLREAMVQAGHGWATTAAAIVLAESSEASPAVIAATLQAATTARPALTIGATALAWLTGHKKLATVALLAAAIAGGYGAYLGRRPELTSAAKPPPPTDTLRQRNLRVLHGVVLPEVVQALKPMLLGGGEPRVTRVAEDGPRLVVELEGDHTLLKRTLFTSRTRLRYDERHGGLTCDLDQFAKGDWKRIKLNRPVQWTNDKGGLAWSMNLDSVQAMGRAFHHLTSDPPPLVSPTAVADRRISAAELERYRKVVGYWYAEGDRLRPVYVYVADDGRAMALDHDCDLRADLNADCRLDGDPGVFDFGYGAPPFRLTDGGRRLATTNSNAYWTREPNVASAPRFEKAK